jgi:myo-inositol-1(or 4)-monophosphatase
MLFTDLKKLESLVKLAAKEELMTYFGCSDYEYKDDGSVVTPADLSMQNRLQQELNQHWPEYDILGEEMSDAEQMAVINRAMQDKDYGYWCIDPLDGTTNYASGLPFFCVSIALIINNRQQLGLIYDPIRDEMYTAVKGQGAYFNDQKIDRTGDCSNVRIPDNKPLIAEIDMKRLPEKLLIQLVSGNIFASHRNLGSSALDWCWLATGRFDIFLHGGHKLWDYAAGSLIFSEAGGYAVSLDSNPVFRGQLEIRSVLACYDEVLFKRWSQWAGIADGA